MPPRLYPNPRRRPVPRAGARAARAPRGVPRRRRALHPAPRQDVRAAARASRVADAVVRLRPCRRRRVSSINDRADIARMTGADGVHVGQDDLAVEDVRRIVGPDAIVGVSTHDEAQIEAAARTSASYIAVGPIYGTATRTPGMTRAGSICVQAGGASGRPVVAIGGITLERAPEVLAAGAASVAVISGLLTRRSGADGPGIPSASSANAARPDRLGSVTYNAATSQDNLRIKGDEWLVHCSGPNPSTS